MCIQFVSCVFTVFFNDTATTEIYTYLHTLALHDALPVCGRGGKFAVGGAVVEDRPGRASQVHGIEDRVARRVVEGFDIGAGKVEDDGGVLARSEEHTSELQSLMRSSYAVFCLKKKKRHQTQAINKIVLAYITIYIV